MLPSDGFVFDPRLLNSPRPEGISAFMRIKNGEDFLEAAIDSHIEFFDEIVAMHNDCTDSSVAILNQLAGRHGAKLRVLCYEPAVHALGSVEHRRANTFSVHSMANYSNYCMANTRYSVVTKLDDDHIAIPGNVERMTSLIRNMNCQLGRRMMCFSGINLVSNGPEIGVHGLVPFAGNGDHWFLQASSRAFFTQDRRFERLTRRGLRMEYHGIAYWHMKFLKKTHGFANYDLERNPGSRFHRQLRRFEAGGDPISLSDLETRCREAVEREGIVGAVKRLVSSKERLRYERNAGFSATLLLPEFDRLRKRLASSPEGRVP